VSGRDYALDTAHRMLFEVGQEQNLAARVLEERKQRGWSQERLARELSRVGCKMPQSAIWKIENLVDGRRRTISVDEAIAFSRVFGLPLATLLLPPDALEQQRLYRDILMGPGMWGSVQRAVDAYLAVLVSIKKATQGDSQWRQRFETNLSQARLALAERRDDDPTPVEEFQSKVQFFEDVLKELDSE